MDSYLTTPFPKIVPSKSPKTVKSGKLLDLEAEDARLMNLYRIYGNQNPTPRGRRGRMSND